MKKILILGLATAFLLTLFATGISMAADKSPVLMYGTYNNLPKPVALDTNGYLMTVEQ